MTLVPQDIFVQTRFGPLLLAPEMDLETACHAPRFQIRGEHANLWFEGRSRQLIVTFDNLATIDEGFPRGPWLDRHLSALGYSVLGVQSHAKDWFRPATAPALLQGLQARGFFARFDKVLFLGASMGGFAAINYAPLVPGAAVLALSPQSTMHRRIAPFEQRFRYSVKRSNWTNRAYLDAAKAVPACRKLTLLYDPFVPEDRAHARRLAGQNVTLVAIPHCTHEAIRVILKSGALPALIRQTMDEDRIGLAFWRAFRNRRRVAKWQQALLTNAAQRRHPRLVVAAATALLEQLPEMPEDDRAVLRRARRQAMRKLRDLAGRSSEP